MKRPASVCGAGPTPDKLTLTEVGCSVDHPMRSAQDTASSTVIARLSRVTAGRLEAPSFRPPSVRQIAVPTTLSAGEFHQNSGSNDPVKKLKQSIRNPHMIPRTVMLDCRHLKRSLRKGSGSAIHYSLVLAIYMP
ncbi:hypothetical protein [Bradyrhizobium erythrophlei]|uniref:hypothetical protein n=1 Tax=Bradyrhizobium erythrophlei TaxID=1437360 RepID=UPI003CC807A2